MIQKSLLLFIVLATANGESGSDCNKHEVALQKFFDTAEMIFNKIDTMSDYQKIFDTDASRNATNVRRVLNAVEMTKICRFYTEIMTYKHQLHYHVFHNADFPPEYITKVTELIKYLQSAAVQLQHIRMASSNMLCIMFTQPEYDHFHKLKEIIERYDVLKSLKGRANNWKNRLEPCSLIDSN